LRCIFFQSTSLRGFIPFFKLWSQFGLEYTSILYYPNKALRVTIAAYYELSLRSFSHVSCVSILVHLKFHFIKKKDAKCYQKKIKQSYHLHFRKCTHQLGGTIHSLSFKKFCASIPLGCLALKKLQRSAFIHHEWNVRYMWHTQTNHDSTNKIRSKPHVPIKFLTIIIVRRVLLYALLHIELLACVMNPFCDRKHTVSSRFSLGVFQVLSICGTSGTLV
jgi:hypothetical protein